MGIIAFLTSKAGLYLLGAIGVAIMLGGLYHHVWSNGYDDGTADTRKKEVAPLQARFDAAVQRATALATLWAGEIEKTETEARKREESQRETANAFATRAQSLSRAPTVVISVDAAKLWGDITASTAQAPSGSVPAKPEPGTKAFSESALVGYAGVAAAAYEDAVGLFHEARDVARSCVDKLNSYFAQAKEAQ